MAVGWLVLVHKFDLGVLFQTVTKGTIISEPLDTNSMVDNLSPCLLSPRTLYDKQLLYVYGICPYVTTRYRYMYA